MNVLISVIVPIYNSQQTLHRCVDSILSQTFTDFELLLVDDGSPDNSGVICDEYTKKDHRVKVIHQANQGAAAARNAGLEIAAGKYIAFCDSDDMVSIYWLERLIHWANGETLPLCSYCNDSENLGRKKILSIQAAEIVPSKELFSFNQAGIAGFLCNSLFEKDIIDKHHLRLRTQKDKGDYNEDLLFALQYIRHISKIVYTGYTDYLYDVREGSLSRAGKKVYFAKYEEKYRLWKEFLIGMGYTESLQDLATYMLYHFLTALNDCKFNDFKQIVTSESVQECVRIADTSRENTKIIYDIRNRNIAKLWLRYQIHKLKGWFE